MKPYFRFGEVEFTISIGREVHINGACTNKECLFLTVLNDGYNGKLMVDIDTVSMIYNFITGCVRVVLLSSWQHSS